MQIGKIIIEGCGNADMSGIAHISLGGNNFLTFVTGPWQDSVKWVVYIKYPDDRPDISYESVLGIDEPLELIFNPPITSPSPYINYLGIIYLTKG